MLKLLRIAAASVGVCLVGCASDGPESIFNPEAVYMVPPEGAWMPDLVDDATRKRTGRIWLPPGAFVVWEPQEID